VNAVHASCAIPGIVAPVNLNGRRCSDGGVVDPVPVEVMREYGDVDLIIAVTLVPTLEDIHSGRTIVEETTPDTIKGKLFQSFNKSTNLFANGNTVDTLRKSVRAAQAQIAHISCSQADVVICPEAFNLPWHSFEAFEEIVEAGRQATEAIMPELTALIEHHSRTSTPHSLNN